MKMKNRVAELRRLRAAAHFLAVVRLLFDKKTGIFVTNMIFTSHIYEREVNEGWITFRSYTIPIL